MKYFPINDNIAQYTNTSASIKAKYDPSDRLKTINSLYSMDSFKYKHSATFDSTVFMPLLKLIQNNLVPSKHVLGLLLNGQERPGDFDS